MSLQNNSAHLITECWHSREVFMLYTFKIYYSILKVDYIYGFIPIESKHSV